MLNKIYFASLDPTICPSRAIWSVACSQDGSVTEGAPYDQDNSETGSAAKDEEDSDIASDEEGQDEVGSDASGDHDA